MSLDEALPLIRATASYLNLTGIAEQVRTHPSFWHDFSILPRF